MEGPDLARGKTFVHSIGALVPSAPDEPNVPSAPVTRLAPPHRRPLRWHEVKMLDACLTEEIIVRTDDRIGVLAAVSRILSDMGINLLAACVRTEGERAAIHLVTTSQTYARDAIREAGFSVAEREVVVIELPHHPGFLCRVIEALARKGIAIEELYATVPEGGTTGLVVFKTSHNSKTVQMLRKR